MSIVQFTPTAGPVTGNGVIVKPHQNAILPLAITVAAIRQTLKEGGFDPNLVSLLVDGATLAVTRDLATKSDIRIIDYTGNADFGMWLESNARQALVSLDIEMTSLFILTPVI